MTNEQLHIYLAGLLAELDTAIDATRDLLPEDAERETEQAWRRRPEYEGALLWFFDETKCERVTVTGEYLALTPLVALREAWQERMDVLVSTEATGE